VEGRSVRGVARELGISRNTVRKYVAADAPVPPCRQEGARARPVLERVRKRIDELLELAKTEKQRPTGSKILDCLRAEGFEIGITTVRDYVRERRLSAKEVYVPLVYTAGDLAEVDGAVSNRVEKAGSC
jgi:transposase